MLCLCLSRVCHGHQSEMPLLSIAVFESSFFFSVIFIVIFFIGIRQDAICLSASVLHFWLSRTQQHAETGVRWQEHVPMNGIKVQCLICTCTCTGRGVCVGIH